MQDWAYNEDRVHDPRVGFRYPAHIHFWDGDEKFPPLGVVLDGAERVHPPLAQFQGEAQPTLDHWRRGGKAGLEVDVHRSAQYVAAGLLAHQINLEPPPRLNGIREVGSIVAHSPVFWATVEEVGYSTGLN